MSKIRDAAMAELMKAVLNADDTDPDSIVEEPEEVIAVSEFAVRLGEALAVAIETMRSQGIIEVQDDSMPALVAEATEAGLDTKSPKQLVKRVIRVLLESANVEEVYGTDEAISSSIKDLLGG